VEDAKTALSLGLTPQEAAQMRALLARLDAGEAKGWHDVLLDADAAARERDFDAARSHYERGFAELYAKDGTWASVLADGGRLPFIATAHYGFARCLARAGEHARAGAELDRAIDAGFVTPAAFEAEADLATFRGSAEGRRIAARLANLPYAGFNLRRTPEGMEVGTIVADGPAAAAGLRVGDRLVEIDGARVESSGAVGYHVRRRGVGERMTLAYERGGQRAIAEVTLGRRP